MGRLLGETAAFLLTLVLPARAVPAASQTGMSFRMVGQIGGPTQAVAVQGNYAYVGVGLRLVVLDVSNPASMREVGATPPFPHFVEGVAISGTTAYVAAGGAGLRVVDISKLEQPVELGAFDTRGYSEGVAVAGTTVYLADGPYGLRVFDASNPRSPKEVGAAYVMNYAFEVAVSSRYAYIAAAGAGLLVADVSNPARPVEVSTLNTPGYAYGVAAAGNLVYMADGWEGVRAISVVDPQRPVQTGSYKTAGWAFGVAVSGRSLYVADAFKGLRVLDASTLSELGSYEVAGGHAGSVAVAGGFAYVADRNWGLHAVSVSTAARPTRVGFYGPLGYADGVAVQGNYAYVAAGSYGFRVVDVSDPMNPKQLGAYDTDSYAARVAAAGKYAYVVTRPQLGLNQGLHVLEISNPARPMHVKTHAGSYQDMEVVRDIAYLATAWGLEILRLSDPAAPTRLGWIDLRSEGETQGTTGVAVSGTTAYVAKGWDGVKLVDVSDPARLRVIGSFRSGSKAQDVVAFRDRAYVVEHDGLRLFDVSNPAQPLLLSSFRTPGDGSGVAIREPAAYVTHGVRGLSRVDVSDPLKPRLEATFDTPGSALGVALVGERFYVSDGPNGILILELEPAGASTQAGADWPVSVPPAPPRSRSAGQRPSVSGWPFPFTSSSRPGAAPPSVDVRLPIAAEKAGWGAEYTSTCVVTSPADSGQGTLRGCLGNAARGTLITFAPAAFPPSRPATIKPLSQLPSIVRGEIAIDASSAGVILDGSGLAGSADGFTLASDGNALRGLQILGFPGSGVLVTGGNNWIGGDRKSGQGPVGQGNVISGNGLCGVLIKGGAATGNVVVGNFIGTDVTGIKPLGNREHGVSMQDGASSNRIGGLDPRDRNIVGANGSNGILVIYGANGNLVLGNHVGTDITGTLDLGNGSNGIAMLWGGFSNLIRGNLASGNRKWGINMSYPGADYNVVVGNLVGTDVSGSRGIPNVSMGVAVGYASFNRIGGRRPEERNLISGNGDAGVEVFDVFGAGAHGNLILGNYVGTDVTGALPLPNGRVGVGARGSGRTFIGGTTPQERNVISATASPGGVGGQGVAAASDHNVVLGNYIGTDHTGRVGIGNSGAGVSVSGRGNVIQGNIIGHAGFQQGGGGGHGVSVGDYPHNPIRRNSIHSNARKGILTISGGNNMLAPPRISTAAASAVWGFACPGCEVEIFSDDEDEGRVFEGSVIADPTGAFTFEKGGALTGPNITATATDADGSTSEFSAPRKLVRSAGPLANLSAASYAGDPFAVESIVAAFGSDLARTTERATTLPLPATLAGTTVTVVDRAGVERSAPLYFASPTQVNYQMPPGTALGVATVTVTNADGVRYAASVEIAAVAPGLFSAAGTGQGVAAANVLRLKADGAQTYEPVTQPIDLDPETVQVYLLLYGTGIRGRSSLGVVRLRIGGVELPVSYAGPQPEYPGLDQVNVLLPRTLRGRGEVEVALTVDGKTANPVRLNIR